jgi:hypothetical protein
MKGSRLEYHHPVSNEQLDFAASPIRAILRSLTALWPSNSGRPRPARWVRCATDSSATRQPDLNIGNPAEV